MHMCVHVEEGSASYGPQLSGAACGEERLARLPPLIKDYVNLAAITLFFMHISIHQALLSLDKNAVWPMYHD